MSRFVFCLGCMLLCLRFFTAAQHTVRVSGPVRQPLIDVVGEDSLSPGSGLFLLEQGRPAVLPVQCRFETTPSGIRLSPLYPLASGSQFLVHIKGYRDTLLQVPVEARAVLSTRSKVLSVFPLADTIPENILFFHVVFSERMADDREAWKKVHVYDASHTLIPNTWRQRSFWLDSGRLLVLMIHPGRVKSGIHYTGPVFLPGQRYTIEADSSLRDVYGRTMGKVYRKIYDISFGQREKLLVDTLIKPLSSHGADTMRLSFDPGLDHATAMTNIIVYNSSRKPVPCHIIQVTDKEVLLVPYKSWPKGPLSVELGPDIYDCAGNRLHRSFEVVDGNELLKDKDIYTIRAFAD